MEQDDQRKTRSEDSRWSNKVARCRTGRIFYQDDQRKTRSEDSGWTDKVATCGTGRIWPRMIR